MFLSLSLSFSDSTPPLNNTHQAGRAATTTAHQAAPTVWHTTLLIFFPRFHRFQPEFSTTLCKRRPPARVPQQRHDSSLRSSINRTVYDSGGTNRKRERERESFLERKSSGCFDASMTSVRGRFFARFFHGINRSWLSRGKI